MWGGFGHFTTWGSMLVILVIGYAVFTLTMGIPWIGALIGFAAFGIGAGLLMGMGRRVGRHGDRSLRACRVHPGSDLAGFASALRPPHPGFEGAI
jgi:hypothetical protein